MSQVFVPKHFVTSRGGHAVRCSLKANDGLLYPLAKAFIFINKPTVYIKFEDIEIIDFKRYDQNAATRNFDLVITLKSSAVSSNEPKEYNFSSIDRAEFPALIDYIQSKEIPVNKPEVSSTSQSIHLSGS
jgi:structure-specific recognition protein 1